MSTFRFQKIFSGIVVLLLAVLMMPSARAAWQEPTQPPPLGNVSAPINVSSQAQAKQGGLTVGTATPGSYTLFSQGTLGVSGATTLQGTLTVSQAAVFQNTVNIQAAADLDTTLNVDGAATFQNTLRVNRSGSAYFLADNATGRVLVRSAATGTAASLIVSGNATDEGINVTASATHGIEVSTTAAGRAAIAANGGVSSKGLEVRNSSATSFTLDAINSATGANDKQGVAIYGKGANLAGAGSLYSTGVYAESGAVTAGVGLRKSQAVYAQGGTATGGGSTAQTFGVYAQAGSIPALPAASATTTTYGIYALPGTFTNGYSYAGYFSGTTQACGAAGCTTLGSASHSARFSKGPVYISQTAPLQGGMTVENVGTVLPASYEDRAIRVNNGLYLSYDGNQDAGSLLLHDQAPTKKDHVYRIKVEAGRLKEELLSVCKEGLYCVNNREYVTKTWNGISGPVNGACVDSGRTACAGSKDRCLSGQCVTRCEFAGYFCDLQNSPACGSTTGLSCGTGSLVCCTGS